MGLNRTARRIVRFVVAVLVGWCISNSGFAQTPSRFDIDIRRMPQLDGSTVFELDLPSVTSQRWAHLPDGTVFNGQRATVFATQIYTSFNELKDALVGTWTIEVPAVPVFGLPRETYTFEFSDFPETVFPLPPPEITFPIDGSRVPPEFTMTWEWPTGVTPPQPRSRLARWYGPGSRTGGSNTAVWDQFSAEVSAAYSDGEIADSLDLWVSSWALDAFADHVSDVTPQQSMSRFDFDISARPLSLSTPVNVTIALIPECGTFALAAISATSLALIRQRRRRG